MVPTSYPLEDIFEAQNDVSHFHQQTLYLDNVPLDIYSTHDMSSEEDYSEEIFGPQCEYDALLYDIDSSPHDDSSTFATFVCTQQDKDLLYLAQPEGKVKKTWYNCLLESPISVDPTYALDTPVYWTISTVHEVSPSLIHATFLGPTDPALDVTHLNLNHDGTITSTLPSGFKFHTLIDTGCNKTILNRKLYLKHQDKFTNFRHITLQEKHSIVVGNGQVLSANILMALPLHIQNLTSEFLVLVTDILDNYDLIIGLEALMQLEVSYFLATQVLFVEPHSIPLYPTKHITLPQQSSTPISISGKLPSTFLSGKAIVRIQPIQDDYSFLTVEVDFLNQSTCFIVTNTSSCVVEFPVDIPFGYFDLRSLGYYTPPTALKTLYPSPYSLTYISSFQAAISCDQLSQDLPDSRDTMDPYPWLDLTDPRRFQTDREILESAIDLSQSSLTAAQKIEFYDLLEEFKDAFSLRDEIGLAPGMQVNLELIDTTPFFIRPFSVKEDMKEKINKEMERLVTLGILTKGLSGYSSPAMAIPRKNSAIPRVVADFRYLNTKLVQLNMSFPLVKECIQSIGASQCEVMSVIDLRDAYHTLRLAPSSQQFCGITPYYGSDTYLYRRLPMGLKVSPAIWQAFINRVLGPIPHRQRHIAIMDDCLVYSKFNDHLSDLRNLLLSLQNHGLKISPRKCQFFRKSLVYMGFQFLIQGDRPSITPVKDKCDGIRNLEPPKTVRDCRKFCGMVNFLATFLKDLQRDLIPIYNLTKKNVKFCWTQECQSAFDTIKMKLIKPPILRMPDTIGMFRLMSDTSILATGAALYQFQGNAFYIVGYNSKKLPTAAKNYSITELELFGLTINIYAFKPLLANHYFEAFCDHSAIAHILNSKKKIATRRIERLIELLMPFNFSIHYLPGEKMHIADILSHLAGRDLDAPNQLIPIAFTAMPSRRPR